MKEYFKPLIEFTYFQTEDIVTESFGTANDNNYGDLENWD